MKLSGECSTHQTMEYPNFAHVSYLLHSIVRLLTLSDGLNLKGWPQQLVKLLGTSWHREVGVEQCSGPVEQIVLLQHLLVALRNMVDQTLAQPVQNSNGRLWESMEWASRISHLEKIS